MVKPPSEPSKYLGLNLLLTGDWTPEFLAQRKASHQIGRALSREMISPREALLTYKTIILLKIHYPLLPMCFFPEEEAEMESLILLHLLPKMVINCHFPRVVIHGPKSLCGLALPKLETIQAWSHTRFILCHL